ncbi:MAG: EAL domain-containing protein [Pseudomonadota bacterium]
MGQRTIRTFANTRDPASQAGAEPARKVSLGSGSETGVITGPSPTSRENTPPVKQRSAEELDPSKRSSSSDRRASDRASHANTASERARAQEPAPDYTYYLPGSQRGLGIFLLLAYVCAAGLARTVPMVWPLVAAGASVGIVFLGSVLSKLERRAGLPTAGRQLLLALGVITPMALAGYAFAAWVQVGLPWQWAVASLVCINAAGAALFGSRIVSLFTAKISIWASFALLQPSALTVSAVIGAALALMLIARFEWKAAQKQRVASEARERVAARAEDILRSFEDTGQGWFWETDRRGQINYISPSAAQVLGKTVDMLIGQPLSTIVAPRSDGMDAERTLGFHLSARSAFRDIEVQVANNDDEERFWSLTGRPVYDSFKNFCGFRGHGADLTEKRRSEQQVTRLAHYDSLTGLANRVQMSEALEQILAAPRERDRACTVLMLDLDRFKQVNDTMGHPAGDALLKQVALRLERVIDGLGRCGRLGGDEFQVIVPGYGKREAIAHLSKEIISALSQPYTIDGQSVIIGASVGVALAPDDGTTSEDLIRNVDLALYAAKDAGRGVHRFYSKNMHSAAEERAEMELELREAIQTGGLSLYYQPVVFAANEKIVGFEALMRWNHPIRGFISPEKFIAIAEDAGLIDQMGQWALRQACEDLASWPSSIRCAVNVSPLQFSNPELPTIVANALAHGGIDPERLELEITESVFLNDSLGTDAMFKALKRVGVRLALDDFGTGYSSLGYLKKAPFDKIKIDQSFVRGATEDGSRNGAIIASITSLAEALDMDTTAEGVETLDELELVRLLGCSHVQGYIYHKPMDAEDATQLVHGNLAVEADGPKSARKPRRVVLRRVSVRHEDERFTANIRNISESGAMIEGLWNMPVGARLRVEFTRDRYVDTSVRWSRENRVGVEFIDPLIRRADGTYAVAPGRHEGVAF